MTHHQLSYFLSESLDLLTGGTQRRDISTREHNNGSPDLGAGTAIRLFQTPHATGKTGLRKKIIGLAMSQT